MSGAMPDPPRAALRRLLVRGAAPLAALALAACASQAPPPAPGGWPASAWPAPAVSAPPPRPADPLAEFAGRARPGEVAALPLPDSGRVTSVRLARAYDAASGRPCRELVLGSAAETGGSPPAAIYCEDAALGWVPARPLLRGGAVARP